MKVISCLTIVILFNSICYSQESKPYLPANPLSEVTILADTRLKVEGILGKPTKKDCYSCLYSNKNYTVYVNYAIKECRGTLEGWNVPIDTILSYSINFQEKIYFDKNKINLQAYFLTTSDRLIDYYTDVNNGIQFLVEDQGFKTIRYLPSKQDSNKRCKNFVEYNPIAETYYPFNHYYNRTTDYTTSIIELIDIELKENYKLHIGYIVIYSGSDISKKDFEKYFCKVSYFLKNSINIKENLKILYGGNRKQFQVEVFILPNHYPQPLSKKITAIQIK